MLDDFLIRFANVNSNALTENWDKISNYVMKLEESVFNPLFDDIDADINKFFMILQKLVPKRVSFKTTASHFIAFNQVRYIN